MKKTILLLGAFACVTIYSQAQSKKSATAFAITSPEKGSSGWKDVKLVDLSTGEEIQSVFKSGQEIEILNPRTGKAVVKKDETMAAEQASKQTTQVYVIDDNKQPRLVTANEDLAQLKAAGKRVIIVKNGSMRVQSYDKPFATNSAALAYDKKHERLYYTPMGINQLRYIDLRSKTPKIYYFEDEAFGVVKHQGDVAGQIARMVIASDGNGYALSNDANHFMRFTTGKKPEITDLGILTDDASSKISIHNGVGGDLIADNRGNLYLVTAYRNVFKINIETKMSSYLGGIKGLPESYQTNGAVVDGENKIVVCSGTSTDAYYRFDINDLKAERVSNSGSVFNASDLANSNILAVAKKKDEEKPKEVVAPIVATQQAITPAAVEKSNNISVYPNPVTTGLVKVSFTDQSEGRYNVQLLDLAGNLISNQEILITSKQQVQEIKLPASLAKGNYLVKITGSDNETKLVTKLSVQ
jgi:hypothetical protein